MQVQDTKRNGSLSSYKLPIRGDRNCAMVQINDITELENTFLSRKKAISFIIQMPKGIPPLFEEIKLVNT